MDYQKIISILHSWNKDELLYKDYYLTMQTNSSVNDFLLRHSQERESVDMVLHPEHVPKYRPENEFIDKQWNTAIVKHPRYFPLFYHEHEFFEMVYVLSGKCTQHFAGSKLLLSKGDVCLISTDILHGIEVFDDESIVLNLLIRRSSFLDLFLRTLRDHSQIAMFFLDNIYEKRKSPFLLFHTNRDIMIRNYILDMYIEQLQADEFSDQILCSLFTIFFAQLARKYSHSAETSQKMRTSLTEAYQNEFLTYIYEHYSTVTLKSLAEHFHFSVPYCSKLVKEISGKKFSELLSGIRIQKGQSFLLLTQLSVAEISERLGYQNTESFIRAFKRFCHQTPSQYRKQNN